MSSYRIEKRLGLIIICLMILVYINFIKADYSAAASEAKSFDTPVWNPEAKWRYERFAGCRIPGHLDGPRLEMEYYSVGGMGLGFPTSGAGEYNFGSYDPNSQRAHVVAGSARGYLDGPFSRARFGGWDYVKRIRGCFSRDLRYRFMTDPYNGSLLRRLDFKEQQVQTIMNNLTDVKGIVTADSNHLYIIRGQGEMIISDYDGNVISTLKLQMTEKIGQWGVSLALDPKDGFLYATTYGAKLWYIWYWNLDDGSFHGVLAIPQKGEARRERNEAGPFPGTNLYTEGNVFFGPDDPEKRFLYTGRTDTWTFFRLDLEKKHIWALTGRQSKKTDDQDTNEAYFIDKGIPNKIPCYGGVRWMSDGSFVSRIHSPFDSYIFRRIR